MCGILGLLSHDPSVDVSQEICEGLSLLQHRGQDACGIVTCGPKGRFYQCKANGMVRDVFDTNSLSRLVGGMGIGHGTYRHKPIRYRLLNITQSATLLRAAQTTQKLSHSTSTPLTVSSSLTYVCPPTLRKPTQFRKLTHVRRMAT